MPRAERDLEHVLRPSTLGVGLEVSAAEETSAQFVWADLPEGRHTLAVGSHTTAIDHPGGPGAATVEGLEPRTHYEATLRDSRAHVVTSARFRTGRRPAGAELFRFATISDLHLGHQTHRAAQLRERAAAHIPHRDGEHERATPHERATTLPHDDRAFRCARGAIEEAIEWGAQLIVVKGDICEETVEETWDLAASLLGSSAVPVLAVARNHDTGELRRFDPFEGAAERGLHLTRGVEHLDVDGLRIVMVDSTIPGSGWGDLARHRELVAQLAADADGGTFVATHHQAQRFRVPLYWPHGVPGPNAREFARAVRSASDAVLVSSGHTHRNRHRRVAGLDWSEVAATSHFPAAWGGYTVYEGGLTQTVRRTTEPTTLEWSQHSRRMLGGVWALWSTGSMSDRCFSLDW